MLFCSATSGSCMIRTKLAVLAGTLVHSSFGETGVSTDWVYLAGISEPSANAGLVSVIPGPAGPLPILPLSCATAAPVPAASRIVKKVRTGMVLIISLRPRVVQHSIGYPAMYQQVRPAEDDGRCGLSIPCTSRPPRAALSPSKRAG